MECRVLKSKQCEITQYYNNNHQAIDLVGKNYTLDYITTHSIGKIIELKDGRSNIKGSVGNLAYGNYVKIEHEKGYYTLYAHMQNNLPVKVNQIVNQGDIIGYMGDSGNAYGKHLHFEIWKNNTRINPKEFLNKNLPTIKEELTKDLKYKIGDIVKINGVFVSSTSTKKLRPLITEGIITRIVENALNPYLLNDGKIGWINENVIISNNKYLSNKKYKGQSIIDALKEINVDSSYENRTKLAKINNIIDYSGKKEQNIKMLNLLKQGLLKY